MGSNSSWSCNAGNGFAGTKGCYNPKMHHIIPVHNWRKWSQVIISLEFLLLYSLDNKSLVWLILECLLHRSVFFQWAVLVRKCAKSMVDDDVVFPILSQVSFYVKMVLNLFL